MAIPSAGAEFSGYQMQPRLTFAPDKFFLNAVLKRPIPS
jgi:hypothetical protein